MIKHIYTQSIFYLPKGYTFVSVRQFAKENNVSESTVRRRWKRYFKETNGNRCRTMFLTTQSFSNKKNNTVH